MLVVEVVINPPCRLLHKRSFTGDNFQEAPKLHTELLQGGEADGLWAFRWVSVLHELNSGEAVITAGARGTLFPNRLRVGVGGSCRVQLDAGHWALETEHMPEKPPCALWEQVPPRSKYKAHQNLEAKSFPSAVSLKRPLLRNRNMQLACMEKQGKGPDLFSQSWRKG